MMGIKFKKLVKLSAAAMLLVTLAACGNQKKEEAGADKGTPLTEEQTIEFWTISLQPTFNEYFEGLISEFEAENEGITVEWKDYPFDALQNKLLTAISSKQAPDVVNLNSEMVLQMGGKGALANVDELLSSDVTKQYFEGIYDSTKIDDQVYGVPWYSSVPILFMNGELVKEAGLDAKNPPKTMAEYSEWAKTIKEKTGVSGFTAVPETKLFAYEGIEIISEDGKKAMFNSPEGIKMVEKYQGLVNDGVAPKEILDFDKQVQIMGTKNTAMTVAGTSFINNLKTTAQDVYKNIVSAPTPLGLTEGRISTTMFVSIPDSSTKKAAASKFSEFLTNDSNQLEFSKLANTLPSTKSAIEDPYFTESDGSVEGDAKVASASGMNQSQEYSLRVANSNEIISVIGKALQNTIISGHDATTELNKAAKEVDAILAED